MECQEFAGAGQTKCLPARVRSRFLLSSCSGSCTQLAVVVSLLLFFFLRGTLEVITVTWLPANGAVEINKRGRKVFLAFLGAHTSVQVVTFQMSLRSAHLSETYGFSYWLFAFLAEGGQGSRGVWGEGYLFGCSLAIQAATFRFEGQELSIRTLIS